MPNTDSRFFTFNFSPTNNGESRDPHPLGLSFKQEMFKQDPNNPTRAMTRGMEPTPTHSPRGPDGGADGYVD